MMKSLWALIDGLQPGYYERKMDEKRAEMNERRAKMPWNEACNNEKVYQSPSVKFDADKPPVWQGFIKRFPRAILAIAEVSAYGKKKYGTFNGWETVPDAFNRYSDATARHLVGEAIDPIDGESQLLQLKQTAWGALARLELYLREREQEKI
jgi:hypothetical protein